MTCEEIRDQLVETARARDLSSDLRKIVFQHAADCVPCGRRLHSEQRLTRALGALADAAGDAPGHLEQDLLRQLRVVPIRRTKAQSWVWGGMAAAAAAFAFFVVNSTVETPRIPVAPPMPPSTVSSQGLRQTPPAVAKVNIRRSRPLSKPPASEAAAEDFSRFIPLPNEPELGPEEQAGMLRVQMPREALRSMGLAVDDEFGDEPIQADVLVGMDGTARAIRVAN